MIVRVRHPDYVGRQCQAKAVFRIIDEFERGLQPSFGRVALVAGREHEVRVVSPDGDPVAGVLFSFRPGEDSPPDALLSGWIEGESDARGRLRVRIPECLSLDIRCMPEDSPTIWAQHLLNDANKCPDGVLPEGLGTFVLRRARSLEGRVLDLQGRPVVGRFVLAESCSTGDLRRGRTDESGAFRILGLLPDRYRVQAEGRPIREGESAPPILPSYVRLDDEYAPSPVELRESPSKAVEIRVTDREGHPVAAGAFQVRGSIPAIPIEGRRWRLPIPLQFAAKLDEEGADPPFTQAQWSCEVSADAGGRAVIHVPPGLQEATVLASDPSGRFALETRDRKDTPRIGPRWVGLGEIREDLPPVEFLAQRSPSIVVGVEDELARGRAANFGVGGTVKIRDQTYSTSFELGADGLSRSRGGLAGA